MDINEISVNYLIKNADQLKYIEWIGGGCFTAECDSLTFEVDTFKRDIVIRDKDTDTKFMLHAIWPRQFDAFQNAINTEEEGEAA